jgi:predicted TIM-barrel fold metal-dependent hydrolase
VSDNGCGQACFDTLGLAPAEQQGIFHDNAVNLYRLM